MIEVKGLRQLQKTLKSIDPQLQQEVKKVNKEAAQSVVDATVPPRRTGTLANSIRAGASLRSGVVRAGSKSVPYAGPIHFGWKKHNIEPNPFLYKALDSRRDEIIAKYEDGINNVIRKL